MWICGVPIDRVTAVAQAQHVRGWPLCRRTHSLSCLVIHSRTSAKIYRLKVRTGLFRDAHVLSREPNDHRRAGSRHSMSDECATILDGDPSSELAGKVLRKDKGVSFEGAVPAAHESVVCGRRGRWTFAERIPEIRGENRWTGGRRRDGLSGPCEVCDWRCARADIPSGRGVLRRPAGGEKENGSQEQLAMKCGTHPRTAFNAMPPQATANFSQARPRSVTTCLQSLHHLPGPRRRDPQSSSQRTAKSPCLDCMAASLGQTLALAPPWCNRVQAQN